MPIHPLLAPADARIVVIIVIIALAICTLAAIAIFGWSLWRQLSYVKSSLPTLNENEEVVEQEEEGSAFDLNTVKADPVNADAYTSALTPETSLEDLMEKKRESKERSLLESLPQSNEPDFALPEIDSTTPAPPADAMPSSFTPHPLATDSGSEVTASPESPPVNAGQDYGDSNGLEDDDEDDDFVPVLAQATGKRAGLYDAEFDSAGEVNASSQEFGIIDGEDDTANTAYEGRRRDPDANDSHTS